MTTGGGAARGGVMVLVSSGVGTSRPHCILSSLIRPGHCALQAGSALWSALWSAVGSALGSAVAVGSALGSAVAVGSSRPLEC